ncbi:EAL domain-containing protein [uncultured Salinisphaera sp.]|uniref:putative bifunctional diguanylate cyclase/phosphodiesterase n=1 Tax=uncultured Salinisphaera sp. TaxID=359372 RepID=UPI0032B22F6E
MQQSNATSLSRITSVFRGGMSRYAVYGFAIAVFAVLMATVAAVMLSGESLTLANLYAAQVGNPMLLALDLMPFVFALWGQGVAVVFADDSARARSKNPDGEHNEKLALQAEARRLEQEDTLTGLANRAYFLQQLDATLGNAELNRTRVGVIVLDLDGFSEVNDQFGAANGDRVLKSVARRLSNATENTGSILARLGGNSFGLAVDALQSTRALEDLAQRMRDVLIPPCTLDKLSLNLAASVGGAIYPDNATDSFGLVNAADGAMQHAKAGGGGFELVQTAMPVEDAEMHSLSAELRTAIEQDQLVLYLQPLIDVQADEVHGMEALVRWQHPRRGFLPPGEFIPRAERAGLMNELSKWVLRRALEYNAALRKQGWSIGVSVNLSARSLLDPEFPDLLADLLATYEVPSEVLTIEITEDTLMSDQRRTMDVVTRVSNMGIHISIDDFGTGYSQLTYLKRLPASEIKIDRSFVTDMLESDTDMAIVKATIELGHALGLRAVAEGIEYENQSVKLRELGCDIIQGYYMGRPMPFDKLCEWLAEWQLHHQSRAVAVGESARGR